MSKSDKLLTQLVYQTSNGLFFETEYSNLYNMKNKTIETLQMNKEELKNKYQKLLSENGKFNELKQLRIGLKSIDKRIANYDTKMRLHLI